MKYIKKHLEREQIEAALKESNENFQKVFMLSPNPIFITTYNQGRIVEVNEIVLKTFGYTREEIINKTLCEINLISLEDFENIKIMLQRNGNFRDYELHMYSSSNQDHTCLSSGQLLTFHGETCVIQTVNDITERKRMEKELLKSKNLESIGILAGGIARDFNDYLTSIMGNISIAKMSLHDGEKIHRALIRAEDISVKAAALASRLLTFSEGGEPIYREVTITHVIQEIVQYGFPHESVKFDYRLKSGIRNVLGDEGQLHQILTNILLNAIESMPNGGIITIEANNTELPEDNPYGLAKGDYVVISITDTGVGIPMENLDKIYDPFFSTKDSLRQNGIGLGLSICQSIINKHQGHIQVTSKIGEGTTVTLHIPAYTETPMVKER